MQLVFGRRVRAAPVDGYRTRLLRSGDEVTLNAYFGHSRVKSYLKCGRAFPVGGCGRWAQRCAYVSFGVVDDGFDAYRHDCDHSLTR
jgi:hypothetical protein